jgi:hypothetical protein
MPRSRIRPDEAVPDVLGTSANQNRQRLFLWDASLFAHLTNCAYDLGEYTELSLGDVISVKVFRLRETREGNRLRWHFLIAIM